MHIWVLFCIHYWLVFYTYFHVCLTKAHDSIDNISAESNYVEVCQIDKNRLGWSCRDKPKLEEMMTSEEEEKEEEKDCVK